MTGHGLTMKATKEECVYGLIERAAIEGRRCPKNSEIAEYLRWHIFPECSASSIPGYMRRLIREGRIIVRVYGHNWRDVIIVKGPHSGKRTLPPPHGGKPYIVIDASERAKRDAKKWHD